MKNEVITDYPDMENSWKNAYSNWEQYIEKMD